MADDGDKMGLADRDSTTAPRHVPEQAPHYLKGVLRMAGLDTEGAGGATAFQDLTDRVPLVAVDAGATLVHADRPVADPVEHVQFAAFDPNHMRRDEGGLQFPVSAFAARLKSGRIIKTTVMDVDIRGGSLVEGTLVSMGRGKLMVPYATAARTSVSGVTSLHFMGMGRTPDYSVVINPRHPSESYMVAFEADGSQQQYQLTVPSRSGAENWVVALEGKAPEKWASLTYVPEVVAQADTGSSIL
jgi:hypothetical protein